MAAGKQEARQDGALAGISRAAKGAKRMYRLVMLLLGAVLLREALKEALKDKVPTERARAAGAALKTLLPGKGSRDTEAMPTEGDSPKPEEERTLS